MLSKFVGQVDVYSAAVLIAIVACIAVVSFALLTRRRQEEIANNFLLAKLTQEGANARSLLEAETNRDVKIKQLEQNLITSHRVDQSRSDADTR